MLPAREGDQLKKERIENWSSFIRLKIIDTPLILNPETNQQTSNYKFIWLFFFFFVQIRAAETNQHFLQQLPRNLQFSVWKRDTVAPRLRYVKVLVGCFTPDSHWVDSVWFLPVIFSPADSHRLDLNSNGFVLSIHTNFRNPSIFNF